MSNRKLLQALREEGIAIRQDEDGWYWEHSTTGDESGYPRYSTSSQTAIEAAIAWDIEVTRNDIGELVTEQVNDGADPGDDNDYLQQFALAETGSHYEGSWDDMWDLN